MVFDGASPTALRKGSAFPAHRSLFLLIRAAAPRCIGAAARMSFVGAVREPPLLGFLTTPSTHICHPHQTFPVTNSGERVNYPKVLTKRRALRSYI